MNLVKIIAISLASVSILAGCATTDTGNVASTAGSMAGAIGMNVFKTAVDQKCRSELNDQPIYRTASMVMTQSQKQALENNICGCVSEKAPQSVTLVELSEIAIDSNARTQIVARTVSKTISACVSEFVKNN